MRFLILLSLFISQSIFADWVGTYQSTSQQGLAVEFNAQNEYLLYAIQQNGQQSNIEFGQLAVQGQQINFNPQNSITGTLTPSNATVIKAGCAFTWGQAGEFKSAKAECQAQPTASNENIVSTFTSGGNLLEIPKLAVPNTQGGLDLYKVVLKLISTSPLNLQMQSIEPVANSSNAMSGLYYPQEQLIYLPALAVEPNSPQMLPIFQLAFKVISFEPFVVTQYAPFQYQYQNYANQPQDTQYQSQQNYNDYASFQREIAHTSKIMQIGHETTMAIINNMGDDGSCNGQYDPSNGCY
ncbi:MAG: hypothetical protein KAG10_02945 [Methylococcales bacterium]|nr:hypothetical protein [Methylococcales bacterium]MCK5924829.1 hypothetical protein [Methylococcales bacterium]